MRRAESGLQPRTLQPGSTPARTLWPRAPGADLPHGVAVVEAETQSALAAVNDRARDRFVDLQVACEPHLLALADPGALQSCLRDLLAGAIDRAVSGVLVTATQRPDTVEITVMDDGGDRSPVSPAAPQSDCVLPAGASLTASYRPDDGTTIVLRLPRLAGQDDRHDDSFDGL